MMERNQKRGGLGLPAETAPARAVRKYVLAGLLAGVTGPVLAGTIEGVIFAPEGEKALLETFVIACDARGGRCNQDSPRTRFILINAKAPKTPFRISGLEEGEYMLVAMRDINGDGLESSGDWSGQISNGDGSTATIRPPAHSLEIRLGVLGAPHATSTADKDQDVAENNLFPTRKTGVTGLYFGVRKRLSTPRFGYDVAREFLGLLPDGTAFMGIPGEGLKGFSVSKCKKYLRCARYEVQGNQVILRWVGGGTDAYSRSAEGHLAASGSHYRPLAPLDQLRLEGIYRATKEGGGAIGFQRDGRFVDTGVVADIRANDGNEHPAGAGRYEIAENTLELRYDDGRTERLLIYAFPEALKGGRWERFRLADWEYALVPQ